MFFSYSSCFVTLILNLISRYQISCTPNVAILQVKCCKRKNKQSSDGKIDSNCRFVNIQQNSVYKKKENAKRKSDMIQNECSMYYIRERISFESILPSHFLDMDNLASFKWRFFVFGHLLSYYRSAFSWMRKSEK